ncbi:phosphatase PAP2 family protein [Rossellomorea sp. SC111]|uniref:phosphatase PAP2 family protein n=1 Tax=Rossellomorea sp. SC111 TaxID=2968985 RepID=UPI00215A9B0A|nr:phosphatase PAP2 family protein [Rossellomorea sp. SC111]MCR8846786.1 phosphatase PAP2 family protein [Rossellomorea sp. SC111]
MKEKHIEQGVFVAVSLLCLIVFTWGFVSIVEEWKENEIAQFDNGVFEIVRGTISPNLTEIMTFITFLGGIKGITIFSGCAVVILLFMKKYPLALFVSITIMTGAGFNGLLKWIFKRERPDIEALIQQGGYSFPSGHSMSSFIFYGSLAFILFRALDRKRFKWASVILVAMLVLLIGMSRIYLGVHYPSDILGGFTAGGAWLTLCITIYMYFYKRKHWREDEDMPTKNAQET